MSDPSSLPGVRHDAADALARRLAAAGQGSLVAQWPAPHNIGLLTTTRADPAPANSPPLHAEAKGADATGRIDLSRRHLLPLLPSQPVWLHQVHGADVVVLDADTLTAALTAPPIADAVVTRLPDVLCAVLTADCLPVAITDRHGSAIGLAHAGWRGLASGVLEATVRALMDFGIAPADMIVWFGPAIGPASFEVGPDVVSALCNSDPDAGACFLPHREGKWLADLYGLARRRLNASGVRDIHGGGLCTVADAQRFPSYRRDRTTQRMATLLWRAQKRDGAQL